MEVGAAVRLSSFASLQGCSAGASPVRLACLKPTTVRHSHHSSTLSSATSFRFRSRLILSKPLVAFGGRKSLQPVVAKEGVERTYVMVKPDGVQRGIVGEILSRFERKGFALKGLKLFQCTSDLAEEHYGELKEKPFFPKLVKYIISGPVVCMVWEGPGVVASARKLIGSTNPLTAEPGTIRGDLAIAVGRNVVHGSDSPDNAEREIALWFAEGELVEWEQHNSPWLLE